MSTPIANVALTNTFNNWRIRTNRIVKRINAFARTESSLHANTITANVQLTALGTTNTKRIIATGQVSSPKFNSNTVHVGVKLTSNNIGTNILTTQGPVTSPRVAANTIVAATLIPTTITAPSIDHINVTANTEYTDNSRIKLGTGKDLQLFHDGSNSYIKDVGTGNLIIEGSQITIRNNNGTEALASFSPDGAVSLYFDNSVKLATTSTGVNVTGTTQTDNLTLDPSGTLNSESANTNFFGTHINITANTKISGLGTTSSSISGAINEVNDNGIAFAIALG